MLEERVVVRFRLAVDLCKTYKLDGRVMVRSKLAVILCESKRLTCWIGD
jgi:hypothetical protein